MMQLRKISHWSKMLFILGIFSEISVSPTWAQVATAPILHYRCSSALFGTILSGNLPFGKCGSEFDKRWCTQNRGSLGSFGDVAPNTPVQLQVYAELEQSPAYNKTNKICIMNANVFQQLGNDYESTSSTFQGWDPKNGCALSIPDNAELGLIAGHYDSTHVQQDVYCRLSISKTDVGNVIKSPASITNAN